MIQNNVDIELMEFLDLINHTLSNDFIDKWKHKYSTKFIKQFQLKLLESMSKNKVLNKKTLFRYLTVKLKYSNLQVENFFQTIDINLYHPLIS